MAMAMMMPLRVWTKSWDSDHSSDLLSAVEPAGVATRRKGERGGRGVSNS